MDRIPLSGIMSQYGTITASSGNGGIIHPWDRKLLEHYKDREITFIWTDPVDDHAYVWIR